MKENHIVIKQSFGILMSNALSWATVCYPIN